MTTTGQPGRPIRVLIVDDHALMREGLAAVIQGEPDMAIAAQAKDGREALESFRTHRPDVIVMDLQMPEMDGVAATAAICAEWPNAKIVVLTTYRGDAQALRALKAGANGFLLKSMVPTSLLEAIRSVHAGQRYIRLRLLQRIAAGGSNEVIAAKLGLSKDMVKSHIRKS